MRSFQLFQIVTFFASFDASWEQHPVKVIDLEMGFHVISRTMSDTPNIGWGNVLQTIPYFPTTNIFMEVGCFPYYHSNKFYTVN